VDREGAALLGLVIARIDGIEELVRTGDCAAIAAVVNQVMPPGAKLRPSDIYLAIKDRADYGVLTMNVEILRARIDANPVLYSARLHADEGGCQAILNELLLDPNLIPQPTLADVKAAMALRVVPKPERVARGAATLVGKTFLG
jgi:hypothetical protein